MGWARLMGVLHVRMMEVACAGKEEERDGGWRAPGVHWAQTPSTACSLPRRTAQVLRLERQAFDSVLSHVWDDVLLPTVMVGGDGAGGSGARGSSLAASPSPAGKGTAATKRALQEAAIKRWFEGLDQVSRRLNRLCAVRPSAASAAAAAPGTPGTPGAANGSGPAGVPGHVAALRQQVLSQCLKRLDALLFYHLLVPGGCGRVFLPGSMGGSKRFGRGPLTAPASSVFLPILLASPAC